MYVGLVAAGATGGVVRALVWARFVLVGSVAGLVVGLAYLIPQWVEAPGVTGGYPETGFGEINDDLPEADFWPVAEILVSRHSTVIPT